MQDQHHWRDRYEVSLDFKHIFWLFSGAAVVLAVVFGLGVLLGKHLAGTAADGPEVDPLALLDQLSQGTAEEPDDLSFASTLTKGVDRAPRPAAKNDRAAAESRIAQHQDHAMLRAAAPDAAIKPQAPESQDRPPVTAPPLPSSTGALRAALPAVISKSEGLIQRGEPQNANLQVDRSGAQQRPNAKLHVSASSPQPTVVPLAPVQSSIKPLPTVKAASKTLAKAAPERSTAPSTTPSVTSKTQYSLQLSSFQNRAEAEQFVAALRTKGLTSQIVPSEIPGRGVWFRVRVGSYASWDEAVRAKGSFERLQGVIAYVVKR